MLVKPTALIFLALLALVGCGQRDARRKDEERVRWVGERLRCVPEDASGCETLAFPFELAHVEGRMRWPQVLFAEELDDGGTRSLVIRSGRWPGSPDTLWEYRLTREGYVVERRCLPNVPMEGAALERLRAPDSILDGKLRYSERCRHEWSATYWLEGGRLRQAEPPSGRERPSGYDSYRPNPPEGAIRGIPGSVRSKRLEEDFLPVHVQVGPGPLKASASEGWGVASDAGVAELLWLANARGDNDLVLENLFFDPGGRGLGLEGLGKRRGKRDTAPKGTRTESRERREARSWIEWIRKKHEAGETAFETLRSGQDLQGKSVLLGSPGRLILEAAGIPLLFEAQGSVGARVEVEPVDAMGASWRAFAKALARQGWEGPVLASPPYFLADRTLYNVHGAHMGVECNELLLADGCTGACTELRKWGTTYAEGGLFFVWSGGVKVGTCLDP